MASSGASSSGYTFVPWDGGREMRQKQMEQNEQLQRRQALEKEREERSHITQQKQLEKQKEKEEQRDRMNAEAYQKLLIRDDPELARFAKELKAAADRALLAQSVDDIQKTRTEVRDSELSYGKEFQRRAQACIAQGNTREAAERMQTMKANAPDEAALAQRASQRETARRETIESERQASREQLQQLAKEKHEAALKQLKTAEEAKHYLEKHLALKQEQLMAIDEAERKESARIIEYQRAKRARESTCTVAKRELMDSREAQKSVVQSQMELQLAGQVARQSRLDARVGVAAAAEAKKIEQEEMARRESEKKFLEEFYASAKASREHREAQQRAEEEVIRDLVLETVRQDVLSRTRNSANAAAAASQYRSSLDSQIEEARKARAEEINAAEAEEKRNLAGCAVAYEQWDAACTSLVDSYRAMVGGGKDEPLPVAMPTRPSQPRSSFNW